MTAASLVLLWLVGCLSHRPEPISLAPGDIPPIQLGMTLDQLAETVEGRTPWQFEARQARHYKSIYRSRAKYERLLTHQFTIMADDSRELLCVRSRVIWPSFLFLFSDGKLATIWQSGGMRTAADPEHAVRAILATDPVDPHEFASIIQRAVEQENKARQYYEPPPMPTWLWHLSVGAEVRERAKLLDELDGLKLNLHMSPNEVVAVFGEPNVSRTGASDEVVWVYSAQPKLSATQIRVSLVFQNERVKAIYTQQF